MRVVSVPAKGEVKVIDTDEKYLLNAGHEILGDDLYLQYFPVDDIYVVYDDDAGLKGESQGPLLFHGDVIVAKVIDSDENDLIIGDMSLDEINGLLRLNSK